MDNINVIRFDKFTESLKKIWIQLDQESNLSPFQSYYWNYNWYKNILSNDKSAKLAIIVLFYKKKPVDIFPFVVVSYKGFKILQFLGGKNTDYMLPISTSKSLLRFHKFSTKKILNILDKQVPKYDLCIFENQPLYIEFKKNFFLEKFYKVKSNVALKINMQNLSFDNFIANKSKKFIYDIQRQIKKLQKISNLEFIVEENTKKYEEKINKMISLKYLQYEKTGFNMFRNENFKKLYTDCSYDLGNSKIHLSYLKFNNKIIAIHYGFLSNTTLYYIMPAYDSDFSKFSPGNILLYYLIRDCFKKNIKTFDFTDGFSFYKSRWSNFSEDIYTSYSFRSVKGVILLFFILLKNLLKKNRFIIKIYSKIR